MTYVFKGHVEIVKYTWKAYIKGMSKYQIYMVKFNVSILNRVKIMGFFINAK